MFKIHNFFSKYQNFFFKLYFMQLFSADATMFLKKKKFFFALQNIEKLPKKVAHNPTRPPVFSPASFCFVKLRQF